MQTLFVFQTARGFGKGWTLKEAVANYKKHNRGRLSLADHFGVMIFKAKAFEDVSVDVLNWSTKNGAQFVARG